MSAEVLPELVPGVQTAVSGLVRRVLAPNPGIYTGPGTNTYLIGADQVAVIDPGPVGRPEDDAHLDAVAAAGAGRIRWILATHTHPDHAPGAAGLAERTGAEIIGYDARDDFVPDTEVGDGWTLDTEEFRLRAVHTPGHASNHLCFLLESERALFSGDHIMSGSTVVIRPPDGDMAAYLEGLARLETLRPPVLRIIPGHGNVIEDPPGKVREYVEHRRAREEAIFEVVAASSGTTVAEIVPIVYVGVDEEHQAIARYSVWAHLRKLRADGRVVGEDPDDMATTWRPEIRLK